MNKDINYKSASRQIKSVPLFPKGINRHIDVDSVGDFGPAGDDVDFDVNPNPNPNPTPNPNPNPNPADNIDPNNGDNPPADPNPNPNPDPTDTPVVIDFTTNEYSITDEGLVDTEGKLLKSNEDLAKEGFIDEEGNIIDPTTKEIKIAAPDTTPIPLIDEIQQALGYEFKDETGNVIKFEDTTEGIKQLIDKAAEYKNQQAQQEYFNERPEVRAYAAHLEAGGTKESYFAFAPKDYRNVDITKLDEDQKANIVYDEYRALGISDTKAKTLVEMHKEKKEIDVVAEESLTNLAKRQETKEIEDMKTVTEMRKQEAAATQQFWNDVTTTVKSGKLGNVLIPEAETKGFLEYLSNPIDDKGTTKHTKDANGESLELQLQLAYWRYKGYNFNTMVKNLVTQEKVKDLRSRILKDSKIPANKNNDGKGDVRDGNNRVNSISLDTIS